MNIDEQLNGKTILVTGATSGIGYAVVQYLLSCGSKVVMVARNIEKMKSMCNQYEKNIFYFKYDFENINNIQDIFNYIKNSGLMLDGMVHSAGVCEIQPLKANNIETMNRLMNINTLSFIELVRLFGQKKYSNNNSSIVAVSSIMSKAPEKGLLLYASSKAALNASVVVSAKELLKRDIRVNAILPGFVYTEMYKKQIEEIEHFEEIVKKKQPLGVIEPKYIADFIGYLLSSYSKYMTGLTIPIDAGYLLLE